MFSKELKTAYPEVTKFFINALNKEQLANSYLIISNQNEETVSFAKFIAKILNCKNNTDGFKEPCGHCLNCKWLDKNEHPQAFIVIEPDKESKKEQIKIDEIRELLQRLRISTDYYRVVFFKNANLNTLTSECCNLLLKTVEETPRNTLFIFSSNSKNEVLQTIASRSQIIYLCKKRNVNFKEKSLEGLPTDVKELTKYLKENNISLKEYLLNSMNKKYTELKETNNKLFLKDYEALNKAYLKDKAFMQTKIVLEDLVIASRTK